MISRASATRFLAALLITTPMALFLSRAEAQTESRPEKSDAPPAGNKENGKKLFNSYGCYECHGHLGEGTSVGGARLAPNPIPFPVLLKYVRQPSGQMPPFTTKVVTDAELADIYAYLQSVPQAPKADSLPALK